MTSDALLLELEKEQFILETFAGYKFQTKQYNSNPNGVKKLVATAEHGEGHKVYIKYYPTSSLCSLIEYRVFKHIASLRACPTNVIRCLYNVNSPSSCIHVLEYGSCSLQDSLASNKVGIDLRQKYSLGLVSGLKFLKEISIMHFDINPKYYIYYF